MIKSLISVRFRGLFASFSAKTSAAKKADGSKTSGTGRTVLFLLLFVYLAAVIGGAMCLLFSTLAAAYHALGLDWLYFALAGVMALGFAILGSVFSTQNQLYDAKDNELLLSMPIPPRAILLTRMVPLMGLNLLYSGIVMIPAIAMYTILVGPSAAIALQILSWFFICLLAQAIACVLGWLLHLLLQKANKSIVSITYTLLFLSVYFYVYSQAGNILQSMALGGSQLAGTFHTWIWPLYAMGEGSMGNILYGLAFFGICAVAFAIMYWILSLTFFRTATASRSPKKRRIALGKTRVKTPSQAIIGKEMRKFITTPVYLTNMGLGLILLLLTPVAALIFRGKIREVLLMIPELESALPLLVSGVIIFIASTVCISTPSVSLEGKNIWILKSLPVSPEEILWSKLMTHGILAVPLSALSALATALILGCSPLGTVLCFLIGGLISIFMDIFGMWAGLHWAKLDYINEAYPCKQSPAVLVVLLGVMCLPIPLGIAYIFLMPYLPMEVFLLICAAILLLLCWLLHYRVFTKGIRRWEAL